MISVSQAADLLLQHTPVLPAQTIAIEQALGCVLATDVVAPVDIPPFHQSAMDGYAFRFADWQPNGSPLHITNTIAAGSFMHTALPSGAAVRIFTGAPLPAGADTVVMQEKTQIINQSQLHITDSHLAAGANVRPQGSQINRQQIALPKGLQLNAGAIGYLAMLGINKVSVVAPPRITLLITGNELATPGNTLLQGQVYECNAFAIRAALAAIYLPLPNAIRVPDNLTQTVQLITTYAQQSDLLLITGGVSVGDYDFVPQALQACGAKVLFHKVKQKPGKPIMGATLANTLVVGLPGNPASVYTCFHRYVTPVIAKMRGIAPQTEGEPYTITANYPKKPGLTLLLKGKTLPNNEALPLPNQLSYLMDSFALADCLIELEEDRSDYAKGDQVRVWKIG